MSPVRAGLGPPKPSSTFTNLGVGCLLALVFLVVLYIAAVTSSPPAIGNAAARTPTAADSATAAARMCESLVKDKLMSPTTATFAPSA
jgi:hypothetical protein